MDVGTTGFLVAGAVTGAGAGAGAAAGAGARLLLGRLRRGTRVRAPGCELAVGAGWAATTGGWASGAVPGGWVPVLLALVWFGVAAGLVDLRHRRLPDALTLPALPAALVLLAPLGAAAVGRGALGAVAAVALHAGVRRAAPGSLGGGDVKLAGSLGAVLGAVSGPALVLAAVLASVLTAGAGLLGRRGVMPHGPSMLLATAAVVVASVLTAQTTVPAAAGGGAAG